METVRVANWQYTWRKTTQNLPNSYKFPKGPLTKSLSPQTDFRTIERAFTSLISTYNKKCVGPASRDVLDAFLQVRTNCLLL